MFEPVVLVPCGHSFDRGCVGKWFKESQQSCPNCRASVQKVCPNITLKNLVHEYAKVNNIPIPEPPPKERPDPSTPPIVSSTSPAVDTPPSINLNERLFEAAKNGNLQQLEFYISAGASVHARNICSHSWTPLHYAATFGHPNCVRLLLTNGASIDVKDNDNWTPLHGAVIMGHSDCARVLLAGGASVDTKDNDNRTPLHIAAKYGHPDCVRLLLDNGASVDAKDINNRTPLFYTVEYKKPDCAQILIQNGAQTPSKCSIM